MESKIYVPSLVALISLVLIGCAARVKINNIHVKFSDNNLTNTIDVLDGKIISGKDTLRITPEWDKNEKLKRSLLIAICSQKLGDYDAANSIYNTLIDKNYQKVLHLEKNLIAYINYSIGKITNSFQ